MQKKIEREMHVALESYTLKNKGKNKINKLSKAKPIEM